MEIIGVGIDIEQTSVFQKHLAEQNSAFFERVFTETERKYCMNMPHPWQHFTARFCAKEAAVKAVSSLGKTLITDFEVQHINKCPQITCRSDRQFLHDVGFMVSISHTEHYATAYVLAYKR